MKGKSPESYLIEGQSKDPLKYCYHIEKFIKERKYKVPWVEIKRPFRVICAQCKNHVNKDLASEEIIFELERMNDNALKYAMMAKGMEKVGTILEEKKIENLWEDAFLTDFVNLFDFKTGTEELLNNLVWAIQEFKFDEVIYKFAMFSPELEFQFHPKRNINLIDCRYIVERLIQIYQVYHKIKEQEYKYQEGSKLVTIDDTYSTRKRTMIISSDQSDSEEEEEPSKKTEVSMVKQEEELNYLDIPYPRKTRLEIEYDAPHSALRRAEKIFVHEINDYTEKEYLTELEALRIIYLDSAYIIDQEITKKLITLNMDDVDKRVPIQSFLNKVLGGINLIPFSFSKKLFFLYEIQGVRNYFVIYPFSGTSLKEWAIHNLQIYTDGLGHDDKSVIDEITRQRNKFIISVSRVLRDFISGYIVLKPGISIFPSKARTQKEHFVSLLEGLDPVKHSRKICIFLLKKALSDWDIFDTNRPINIFPGELVAATIPSRQDSMNSKDYFDSQKKYKK